MEAQPQDFDNQSKNGAMLKLELYGLRTNQVRAARLLAEGELTQQEVADRVGVSSRQLSRWLTEPEYGKFQYVLSKYSERIKALYLASGLAERWQRANRLVGLHRRYESIIAARAADPTIQHLPGASTGLVMRTLKQVGDQMVETHEADTALTAEMRQIQEQIARECGHRDKAGASVEVNISIGDRIARARERLLAELPETTITVTANNNDKAE